VYTKQSVIDLVGTKDASVAQIQEAILKAHKDYKQMGKLLQATISQIRNPTDLQFPEFEVIS
jgi:hypothetical protein